MAVRSRARKLPTRGFTPFAAPTNPPPGTYDPALDAQQRAAERGYGDLLQDIERQRGYDYTDVYDPRIGSIAQLGRNRDDTLFDLTRSRDRGMEDLGTWRGRTLQDLLQGFTRGTEDISRQYTRGFEDIGQARTRGTEDYQASVEDLQRDYQRLGGRQTQQARAAGVRGGAAQQAAAKRQANEAIDRRPLDVGFRRFEDDLSRDFTRMGEDTTRSRSRLDEDYNIGTGRTEEDYGRGTQRLGEDYETGTSRTNRDYELGVEREATNYGRGEEGRNVQQYRAGRELGEYRLDTGNQRFFQATQGGYEPPTRPANEFSRPATGPFQVQGQDKPVSQRTYSLPSGQQFNRKQWVGYIRRRRANRATPMLYG